MVSRKDTGVFSYETVLDLSTDEGFDPLKSGFDYAISVNGE